MNNCPMCDYEGREPSELKIAPGASESDPNVKLVREGCGLEGYRFTVVKDEHS